MSRADSDLPRSARIWGRVAAADGARIWVAGLRHLARIGDQLSVRGPDGRPIRAEIVALDHESAVGMLHLPGAPISVGAEARLGPVPVPTPSADWLGHVIDAYGRPQDGSVFRSVGTSPAPEIRIPAGALRRGLGAPVTTGVAAIDTLLPMVRGQRLGIFAGSGVGKSMLLGQLAQGSAADIIVVSLIGERGREVASLRQDLLEGAGKEGRVVIAATSDESALVKRRAAQLAMRTAEHFRDQGHHVLLLFDSVTRFAEAHREIALLSGEAPALRGYPPSTSAAVAQLCERAGPGAKGDAGGDVSAIFTVLVAGSDMDEPIADMLRGVLDGHIVLDRTIAERGRFPAIDLRRSVSRSAPGVWSERETALCARAREVIALREEAAPMLKAGLYAPGNSRSLDEALALFPPLDRFLSEFQPDRSRSETFERLSQILAGKMSTNRASRED